MFIIDGAMGTMLQERGLAAGACPEAMNLEAPEVVEGVHRAYLDAGADLLTTNTFGGNRIKLAEYGLDDRVAEINGQAVRLARAACDAVGHGKVLASIGPTGLFVEPLGDMRFDDMKAVFYEQAQALAAAGADYLMLETFSDLGEARAALLGCLEACDVPVMCSMTFMGQKTLTGVSPQAAAVVLGAMGASAIGCNCSGGPDELVGIIAAMRSVTDLPLFVSPNAGIPEMIDGVVQYPLQAEAFAAAMVQFLPHDMTWIGGCCGTTPEHIRRLRAQVADVPEATHAQRLADTSFLCGRDRVISIVDGGLPRMIGERLNPTARKNLAEAMRVQEWSLIQDEASAQMAAGADLLDVNVGAFGVDEKETMRAIVGLLQRGADTPLVLDNTRPEVLEEALSLYHGKALINSVNGEEASMAQILPIAAKYGASVIALTLDETGIPDTAEGRLAIAERIVKRAEACGIQRKDIYVDCLVMTVGTDVRAPGVTLESMRLVRERLGVRTVLGVSNVSYGLPERPAINSTFLALGIAGGMDLCIINPLDRRMKDALFSAALLAGRDDNAKAYIAYQSQTDARPADVVVPAGNAAPASLESIQQAVVTGGAGIEKMVQSLLDDGIAPLTIINEALTPALNEVGRFYEDGTYYLPQLMLSAETAQKAFGLIEKSMSQEVLLNKGTMVIGTVKGDVHDIGKNMVAVMVKNHGYQVVDLGKNVPTEAFVAAVQEHQAEYVGLSALMTTTMQVIPEVVAAVKAVSPNTRILVGGAVVTADFAERAGADAYGKDAVDTVHILERYQSEGEIS